KLVLHLDEISERELLATLGARATLRLGFHVVTDLNKSARFRLKRKGETGVIRLRGRLNLLEVGYGDLGAYKVKVSASTAGS
ncbi:MAG: hypothetical protein O7G30_04615, partial [Proteobacteria bacterium]|nr:hypothetical protein [Pseudomonadota bacterium]